MVQQPPPKVLNVAEKPSVARALADVFGRLPGARHGGTQRDVHMVATHENVQFPSVYAQGDGRTIQGPGTIPFP
jgi:DNA topoisomerase III